jgi:hypothetical protein
MTIERRFLQCSERYLALHLAPRGDQVSDVLKCVDSTWTTLNYVQIDSTFDFWHHLDEIDPGVQWAAICGLLHQDLVTFSKLLWELQDAWLACMVWRSAVLRAVLRVPIMFGGPSFQVFAICHRMIPAQMRSLTSAENMLSSLFSSK